MKTVQVSSFSVVVLASFATISCSDAKFVSTATTNGLKIPVASNSDASQKSASAGVSDSSAQAPESEVTPPTSTLVESAADAGPVESTKSPDRDVVLDICLRSFESPSILTSEVISATRYANVAKSNANNSVIFSDSTMTTSPSIVRITIDTKVANQGILELNNSMGYYCINYTGQVMNNFTIKAACRSRFVVLDAQHKQANNFTAEQNCP